MPNVHLSGTTGAVLQVLRNPVLRCVGRCSELPAYSIDRHAHPHTMELLYIVEGDGVVELSGKRYPIGPGDIVLYNPGVLHKETFDQEGSTPLFYHIKFDEFAISGLPDGCLLPEGLDPVLPSGAYSGFIETSLDTMFQEWSEQGVGFEQISHNLMVCLILLALRILDLHCAAIDKSKVDALHYQIQQYLSQHFAERISMREVAQKFHINYHYLPHLFQKKLGISPLRYLTELRLNEACHLLSTTKLSIGKIAAQVGYANQSTFQVQFKKIKGMSPLQYRTYYADNELVLHEKEEDAAI